MRAAQRRRIEALTDAIASLPAAAQRQLVESVGLLDQVAAALRSRSADAGSHARDADLAGAAVERGSTEHRRRTSARQTRLDAARARWAEAADQMTAAARRAQGRV